MISVPHLFKTAEVEKSLHLAEVGLCSVAGLLHDGPGISDRLLPLIDTKMIFATSSHKGGVTLICIKFVEYFFKNRILIFISLYQASIGFIT